MHTEHISSKIYSKEQPPKIVLRPEFKTTVSIHYLVTGSIIGLIYR